MSAPLKDAPADFPSVAVEWRPEPHGMVYRLTFNNLEMIEGWRAVPVVAGLFGLVVAPLVIGLTMPYWAGPAFIIWVPALIAFYFYFKNPWKIKRAIEVDAGADALRIYRNGKLESRRRLSSMANLTVGDHPDAELSRLNRRERGQKWPSMNEKRHCLFGWFGTGGAERVILLMRAEYPSRKSLFEVRQAILWAKEQGRGAAAGKGKRKGAAETIRPPLD